MTVWIVLPAHNEAGSIGMLLERMQRVRLASAHVHVLVINNGSTDDTGAVARRSIPGLDVDVRDLEHAGLAPAFRAGMLDAAARAGDEDVVVCMDADDTHNPAHVEAMLARIREGDDIVIASRFRSGSRVHGVPTHRRLLSKAMSLLFQVLTPIPGVRDYSCGYRAYRAGMLKRAIELRGDGLFSDTGFACMVDVLFQLHAAGACTSEVPMELRYDRKAGASKLHVGGTVAQTLTVLARELRRRLGSGR